MRTTLTCLLPALLIAGCANYSVVQNLPIGNSTAEGTYSMPLAMNQARSDEISIILTFSGGGTRAAALSYGVLKALRGITVGRGNEPRNLLQEVDAISAVSGGSFTAAYLRLYGDRIFLDYEDKFLRKNVQKSLQRGLFNPGLWFSRKNRTEMAIERYDRLLFSGATFADFLKSEGPLVLINATDLGYGVRFSFTQEYFNLICSDLSSFSIARAIAASSAVPVLFNPVVLKNYAGCDANVAEFLEQQEALMAHSPLISSMIEGVRTFLEKDKRQYIHLVDGGVSDNLGLFAFYEMVEVYGGIKPFLKANRGQVSPHFLVISVNASTSRYSQMDLSSRSPKLVDTISAVSNTQIRRTNAATLELLKDTTANWSRELSTAARPIHAYFVELDFDAIADPESRDWFNHIPTGLSLSDEEVDGLVAIGETLLNTNPDFRRFLAAVGTDTGR